MIIFSLLIGCIAFLLAGNSLTRFKDTKDARQLTTGIFEILIGSYFLVAAVGSAP